MKSAGHLRNLMLPLFIVYAFIAMGQDTSLTKSKNRFGQNGFYTLSFISSDTKKLNTLNQFFLSANCTFSYSRQTTGAETSIELKTDLSYTRFLDSAWIKNSDNVTFNFLVRQNKAQSIRTSFNCLLKTQLTDTWVYQRTNKGTTKLWKSGPLTPAVMNISYGMIVKLSERSYVNFGLASIKFNSWNVQQRPSDTAQFRAKNIGVNSEYGCTILVSADESLTKFVSLENRTTIFCNGIKKDGIGFDIQNRFWIRLYKNLRLKIENKLVLDTKTETGVQKRTEILLGLFFK
jgi:hypothetical protein